MKFYLNRTSFDNHVLRSVFPMICLSLISIYTMAQHRKYNLNELCQGKRLIGENRTVRTLSEKGGVSVSSGEGYGVVWLKDVSFANGSIEVDLRGKDVSQGSFLGIAFHGTTMNKCEAVYFRPFSFNATDSAQRMHMVQYVFESEFGWERLRTEHPGVYEHTVSSPPDPNQWFHVRIDVNGKSIKVYVNNSTVPSLQVTSLNAAAGGGLGLWVGNSSEGDFKNLKILSL